MLVLAVALSALPLCAVAAGHFDHVASLLDDTLIYAHSTGNVESKTV
jgi:hypothetical protein